MLIVEEEILKHVKSPMEVTMAAPTIGMEMRRDSIKMRKSMMIVKRTRAPSIS